MPAPPSRPLFLSWTPAHGRSTGLAHELGADCAFIGTANYAPRTAPRRYAANLVRTWRELERLQPSGVIVMLPPLPAAWVTYAWARRHRRALVLDAHTGVFNDPKWRWALGPTLLLARRCAGVVVTNEPLAERVRAAGGRAVVLHNPPSATAHLAQAPSRRGGGGVVVVCSWAADEPIDAVLAAAGRLEGVQVSITGKAPTKLAALHPGVRFTGWLTEPDYAELLASADVVVALTTREHTMQQAGYEAMALHLPLVTSDTHVLREFFSKGAVFSQPDADSLCAALRQALAEGPALRIAMAELHASRCVQWDQELAALTALLGPASAEVTR